jgi:hypothetical protein
MVYGTPLVLSSSLLPLALLLLPASALDNGLGSTPQMG